jgi:hypothetical protein
VVYEKALLIAEVAALRAENQYQKQKRARSTGFIQKGGSLSIHDRQGSMQEGVVVSPSLLEVENG